MRIGDLPIVGDPFEEGAEDQVFDSLLLLGPIVVFLIVVAGRTLFTNGIVTTYLISFVGYVLYRSVYN